MADRNAKGQFIKGLCPWNKKVHLKKICKCGKIFYVRPSLDRVKSCSRRCAQIGKHSSKRQKQIASLLFKGNKYCVGRSPWNKGLKGYMAGEKHYNWKGGKSTERHRLMQQLDYKIWREAVFARDNWTCISCGKSKCYLHADHIKPWALYPELRYAIDNGRTLCIPCHEQTESYPKQFIRKEILS